MYFQVQLTIIYVGHSPIYLSLQYHLVKYIYLNHAIFHLTNYLRTNDHQPKCKFQIHVSYRFDTCLHIYARHSTSMFQNRAYYYLTTHQHIFCHQSKHKFLNLLFDYHSKSHHNDCHQPTNINPDHAFYPYYNYQNICYHLPKTLFLHHVVSHLSNILYNLLRLYVCKLQNHLLYHLTNHLQKHPHQYAKIFLFQMLYCVSTILHTSHHQAIIGHHIHVFDFQAILQYI